MERTSVNLETLKDVPGYRVILKTVLQSQIQQLVEQLSKHTEEEAVFLTASLGDGTISHIGSGVGKEFLQENDEVKSKFLAFCLKRHHEISTNKQSKLPKSQDQGPVPLKITGSSIGSSHRHSPYSTSFSKRRNSQRQPPKTPSDQSHNDLNETVIKENDRKILESVSIELAQDYENENVDEYDVTDNEGLSDDLEESDQKSNKIIIKNVTGHYEPNTHADTMGNNNLDAFIPTSNVKDEHVHTSESSAQINAGSGLQFGVCKDISSGVGPAGPSASAATGVYTDLQGNDDIKYKPNSIGHHLEDLAANKYPKEIRCRKKKGEIPVYANLTPTQTKCPYCERNYANNANLKRHIRQHEGIYPYKCDACQQKFSDPTIYKRHITNIKKTCYQFYSKVIADFSF
ncbi:uncharacterized protein LOC123539664 isoform X7 [Mercenaria mercenaria]|uniref:uncharacterized protein LOC123539664 isoform X7 n=1 Tax=Mercenaria mercenaria TaxID=6596 RepID=UPI00234F4488|nr:uncharacterized protein LOC123539664 isoform X7 [Mercenaria mercenaria]